MTTAMDLEDLADRIRSAHPYFNVSAWSKNGHSRIYFRGYPMNCDLFDEEHGIGKAGEIVKCSVSFEDGIYIDVSYASENSIGLLTGASEGQVNHLSDALFNFGIEHSREHLEPCPAQIEAARRPGGAWDASTFVGWGIPWPPPKGWKKRFKEASGCACPNISACQRNSAPA